MPTPTVDDQLSELTERLVVLSRSQAQLAHLLRGARTASTNQATVHHTVAGAPGVLDRGTGTAVAPTTTAVLPPGLPTAHVLRVAPPQVPHRSTKRKYDYFADLESQLASLRSDSAGRPELPDPS